MANLIQAAQDLEYINKDKLIEMAQGGESRYPPYLVLAEIQRRTQLEKSYNAMQPQPTTTVAEEKVAEFAQAGLGGMDSPNTLPPEGNPMSPPPMQMAASGGLTGYANTGRTTYQDTFGANEYPQYVQNLLEMYGPNFEEDIFAFRDMRNKVKDMDDFEKNLADSKKIPVINTKPDFDLDTSNIVSLLSSQEDLDAQLETSDSNRPVNYLENELIKAKQNLKNQTSRGDRGGLAGGTSYIDQAQKRVNAIESQIASLASKDQIQSDAKLAMLNTFQESPDGNELEIQDNNNKFTPPPTTDIFATVDQIKKRLGDIEYNTPTADELRKNRVNETLMGIGALIASSTDRKSFGEGLSKLTANAIASKRLDDRSMTDTAFKKRGVAVQDIQLAATLEGLKSKAVSARNSKMKNDIDLAQVLSMRLQMAMGDEKLRLETQINSLLAPYLSNNASAASSQSDISSMVKNATS